MNSKSIVNCFVWNHLYFEKFAKNKIEGGGDFTMDLHVAPLVIIHCWPSICLLKWGCFLMSRVRMHFKILMKFHSNPSILHVGYGFLKLFSIVILCTGRRKGLPWKTYWQYNIPTPPRLCVTVQIRYSNVSQMSFTPLMGSTPPVKTYITFTIPMLQVCIMPVWVQIFWYEISQGHWKLTQLCLCAHLSLSYPSFQPTIHEASENADFFKGQVLFQLF